MKRELVASCYILSKDLKTLLIFHKKLKKWLPPGGHSDENELPHETALREVKEETGLTVNLIDTGPLLIDEWNAHSIPRPFLCLLENIPAYGTNPQHQHIDMIFIGKIDETSHEIESSMNSLMREEECRWFSLSDIETLVVDTDIFNETKRILKYLFNKYGTFISSL